MRRSILSSCAAAAPAWLLALARSGLLSGAAIALACTPLKPEDDVPLTPPPMSMRGNLEDPWWCLDSQARENTLIPNASEGSRWRYSRRVVDYVSGEAILDVTVRACQTADGDCEPPVAEVTGSEDGWSHLEIPETFSGYFEFTSPSWIPLMLFPSRLSPSSGSNGFEVGMLDLETATGLSLALGAPLDANLGLIMLYMFTCDGMPAAGLQVTSDGGDHPWYVVGRLPSFATSTTSMQGLGGFINVAPGISTVRGARADGTFLEMPQAGFVRPGWITVFLLDPSGSQP